MRFALLLAALALAGASMAAAPKPAHDRLAGVITDYERLEARLNPISAGRSGDREALERLPDASRATELKTRAELAAIRARLQALPAGAPLSEDALNRELLTGTLDRRIEAIDADDGRLNFDTYSGFHLAVTEWSRGAHLRDAYEAQAYVKRLRGAAAWYDANIANARRGAQAGFTQPRPTVEEVLRVARVQAAQDPATSPLLEPFDKLPPALAPQRDALRAQALAAVREVLQPAQARFVRFLETEYLPHARTSLAARDLPGGEAWYRRQVREHTTTDLSPDAIHALGEREVASVRAQMEAVIAKAGWTQGFKAWQAHLRTDPKYYPKTREELLMRSAWFNKRMDAELPKLIGKLPRLPFTVRPIPAESAEGATTAYSEPGAPAIGVAGAYAVNLTHLDQRPLFEIPALSLHESAPGHQTQMSLALELTDLPRFRQHAYYDAYGEGWGLYSERLGLEMGAYTTPEEEFGRLSYEMWRACRLVADTGLHWLRWSRGQARACFVDNTALSAKNIEVELDRYISWPGQALAYKIGQLELLRLRAKATAELGPRFDIRRFHDAVLDEGSLPLDVLARRIDAWIAAEKLRPIPKGAA